ncbi:protein TE33 [Testudinid alphaherpesvirus 3]|uniref:Protein TE33 n=1 Tax=Testudinid alphaherpesvirus 3 TaxID=2560801 RepID=A0A0M3WLV6_9ALPH|nr:protein TE33 [Testudinid alphaherpesvirus 3]AKI81692.1 protein TE33 [Testudinid alphaherpesvirus 3]AKI81795.1 protein TE33 [Testudinid alphaherpesvirus 3]
MFLRSVTICGLFLSGFVVCYPAQTHSPTYGGTLPTDVSDGLRSTEKPRPAEEQKIIDTLNQKCVLQHDVEFKNCAIQVSFSDPEITLALYDHLALYQQCVIQFTSFAEGTTTCESWGPTPIPLDLCLCDEGGLNKCAVSGAKTIHVFYPSGPAVSAAKFQKNQTLLITTDDCGRTLSTASTASPISDSEKHRSICFQLSPKPENIGQHILRVIRQPLTAISRQGPFSYLNDTHTLLLPGPVSQEQHDTYDGSGEMEPNWFNYTYQDDLTLALYSGDLLDMLGDDTVFFVFPDSICVNYTSHPYSETSAEYGDSSEALKYTVGRVDACTLTAMQTQINGTVIYDVPCEEGQTCFGYVHGDRMKLTVAHPGYTTQEHNYGNYVELDAYDMITPEPGSPSKHIIWKTTLFSDLSDDFVDTRLNRHQLDGVCDDEGCPGEGSWEDIYPTIHE